MRCHLPACLVPYASALDTEWPVWSGVLRVRAAGGRRQDTWREK